MSDASVRIYRKSDRVHSGSCLTGGRMSSSPGLRVLNDIDYEIFAKREG